MRQKIWLREMKLITLLFLIAMMVLALPEYILAQMTFERTYGGEGWDDAYSIQQTTDGGYIVAGRTASFGSSFDVYVLKIDAKGDTLWTRTFGRQYDDVGYSVQQTFDGGYIIVGASVSIHSGWYRNDIYLAKIDSLGDLQWTRIYTEGPAPCAIWGQSVKQTPEGGYIITGTDYFSNLGDYFLMRTDILGYIQWKHNYGTSCREQAYSVQLTLDGGYIIVGHSDIEYFMDVWLVKTDSLGNMEWDKRWGRLDRDDHGYCVQQTTDGGYVISGNFWGEFGHDVWLIKTDESGDTLWMRTYDSVDRRMDEGRAIQQTSDSGYIIAGTKSYNSFTDSLADVWLIKTNASGDTLWTRTFGGKDAERGYCGCPTSDGGYIIAGRTKSFGAGGYDIYVIKTDSLGNVGIKEAKEVQRHKTTDIRFLCHPNPFTDKVVIEFRSFGVTEFNSQLANSLNPQLKIYDVSGRLVKDFSLPTAYSLVPTVISWDGRDNSGKEVQSDVYFCRFVAGDYQSTKKLLLLK